MTPAEFLAKHGFPGTPAGERMEADLTDLLAQAWSTGRKTGASRAMRRMSDEPDLPLASEADNPYEKKA